MSPSLTIDDLSASEIVGRIYEFVNDERLPDTAIRAVTRVPVFRTGGRLFGTRVTLANGEARTALAMNIDGENGTLNDHLAAFLFFVDENRFALSRYHDLDVSVHGPKQLAEFLGLSMDDVFPFRYDLGDLIRGKRDALRRQVHAEPEYRLTRAQIIALAVP